MAIRCITFDWGDTLATNYGMPYLVCQRRAFARFGQDLAAAGCAIDEDFAHRALAHLEGDYKVSVDVLRNPRHREIDVAAMFRTWVDAVRRPGCDEDAIARAVVTCGDNLCDVVIPFAESIPALRTLKERGLRLGILSHVPNPGTACRRWFARHGLAPYLDFYSLSSEIGWIKPNPAHFADAIAQAGVAPHEILHVGDHPMRDVDGGRRAGLHTCLRWTEGIYPEAALHACGPDVDIVHLNELPDLLRRFD